MIAPEYRQLHRAMRSCPKCSWTSKYNNRACKGHAHQIRLLNERICPHCGIPRPAAIPTERHCRRCNWTRCHTCSNWYRHPGLTH